MPQPRENRARQTVSQHTEHDSYEHDPYEVKAEPDVRPSGLYTYATEQLDKSVQVLDFRIGQLYERLTVVMTDYDSGADGTVLVAKERPRDAGQVVEKLREVTERLFQMAATLDTIHRRLVLPGDTE